MVKQITLAQISSSHEKMKVTTKTNECREYLAGAKKLGSPGDINFFGYTIKKAKGQQTHIK